LVRGDPFGSIRQKLEVFVRVIKITMGDCGHEEHSSGLRLILLSLPLLPSSGQFVA
jgi:hypothetical protein